MILQKYKMILVIVFVVMILFGLWIKMPLVQNGIWMSPDETANVIFGAHFAKTGNFLIDYGLNNWTWAHGRSVVFVEEKNALAPVGFLGMPFLIGLVFRFFGVIGIMLFTPLLALSALYALYKILPIKWGFFSKISVLLIWGSFPVVVLYANRGVFAQLVVLSLFIWLWYFVFFRKENWRWIIGGVILGLIGIIRPIELIWVIVSLILALRYYQKSWVRVFDIFEKQKSWLIMGVGAFLGIMGLGTVLGYQTYGEWFKSGYQVHPISRLNKNAIFDSGTNGIVMKFKNLLKVVFPFGLHPRNILWNIQHYYIDFLKPWFLLMVIFVGLLVKNWKVIWRQEKYLVLIGFWLIGWLLFYYGNGLYQDNILINKVSLGNSFLRYTLPISLVIAFAGGYVLEKVKHNFIFYYFASLLVLALILGGALRSMLGSEGLLHNMQELKRYEVINQEARTLLNPDTIIISSRSDKVFANFFPVISPLPKTTQILELLDKQKQVAIFLPTQNTRELYNWLDNGLLFKKLFTNKNESLYFILKP